MQRASDCGDVHGCDITNAGASALRLNVDMSRCLRWRQHGLSVDVVAGQLSASRLMGAAIAGLENVESIPLRRGGRSMEGLHRRSSFHPAA